MKHEQNPQYLSYALSTVTAQEQKSKGKVKSKVVHSSVPALKAISVPVPPLPIQSEIVRILDNLRERTNDLTAELTAELTARKKQYEYYVDGLFELPNTPRATLGSILSDYIRGPFGSALKKEYFVSDGIPVYEQQHAINDKRDFRYFIDSDRANGLKRFKVKPDDLIISCSGTIGKISIIRKDDSEGVINQALLILRLNRDKVLPKYLSYYLGSNAGAKAIVTSTGGAITNIEKRSVIERALIPLPSIPEQIHIINILDKFDTLTADITAGLPAEIAARQKQYEYYRDKLLTFKEVGA
jgi:type I restriction enzyme S subunit